MLRGDWLQVRPVEAKPSFISARISTPFRRAFEPQIGLSLNQGIQSNGIHFSNIHEAYALIGKSPLPASWHSIPLRYTGAPLPFNMSAAYGRTRRWLLPWRNRQRNDGAAHRSPELVTKWPAPQLSRRSWREMKEKRARLDKLKAAEENARLAEG